jgi:hypothetical protein
MKTIDLDLTALGGKSSFGKTIRELLGGDKGPLVVDVTASLRDGKLTPESIKAVGDAIVARMKERGLPDDLVAEVSGRLEEAISDPTVIERAIPAATEGKRAEVLGAARAARKLLEDTPDIVLEMARSRVATVKDPDRLAQTSYVLGNISSTLIDVCRGLEEVIEGLESHALTCACVEQEPAKPKAEPGREEHLQAAIDAVRTASGLAPEGA